MDNLYILYQNRLLENRELYSESDSESEHEFGNPNEDIKLTNKSIYLIISSIHRDWTGISKDTFSFNVKFNPVGNSTEEYNNNGVIGISNYKGQTDNTYVNCDNKNILSIGITDIVIPNITINPLDRHKTRFNSIKYDNSILSYSGNKTLKDYPYILVKINEIDCIWKSTGNELNKSLGIMVIDEMTDINNEGDDRRFNNTINNIKREVSNRKRLRYRNIQPWKKEYYPVPKNSLNMLSISITDPFGNVLKLLNDYLEVKHISLIKIIDNELGNIINKIKIVTKKYFSYYEYQEGDIVLFKDFRFNSNKYNSKFNYKELENFINLKKGHIIREIEILDNSLLTSNTFYINYPSVFNYDNGKLEDDKKYLKLNNIPEDDIIYSNNSEDFGQVINSNLQITMSFTLQTVIRDSSIIGSKII